jgi:hypothetical protein
MRRSRDILILSEKMPSPDFPQILVEVGNLVNSKRLFGMGENSYFQLKLAKPRKIVSKGVDLPLTARRCSMGDLVLRTSDFLGDFGITVETSSVRLTFPLAALPALLDTSLEEMC